ncbi:MAG: HNH endonuclease, partial [Cyanobacteriota bacterium]
LMGLQRSAPDIVDANGRLIPLDRIKQRLETWLIAMQARETRDKFLDSDPVTKTIVNLALKSGFFSVWMEVFRDDLFMRTRLIDAFASTRDSGCFDPQTSATVQPAPNPDQLPTGGKI